MSNKIYLLYTCNEWKERASMRLAVATKSEKKLVSQIKKEIKMGWMEVDGLTGEKGIQAFEKQDCSHKYDIIQYGYVDIVEDGEMQ